MRGVFGRGVGWRVCVAFLEVLVTCADVLLAPGGRRRLAACVVDGGWPLLWAAGWWAGLPVTDRSSRPRHGPDRLWALTPGSRSHTPSGERALVWVNVLWAGWTRPEAGERVFVWVNVLLVG